MNEKWNAVPLCIADFSYKLNVQRLLNGQNTGGSYMKIGEVIRKYRKEKQMTQEELADYLGITSSAVNKWENGVSHS